MKRWTAVAYYKTQGRPVSFVHEIDELHELDALIEAGPDFATLDRIEVRYNL